MNDFQYNSIDRLVEFGLGMSIAQQMVSTMNQAMNQMQMPGQQMPQPAPQPAKEWYVAVEGEASGPFTESEIKQKLLHKEITKDNLVWTKGMSAWAVAGETPAFLALLTQLPPSL